ncbi:tagaturonate reductase [Tessaracoccus rhinocerotis]|uniref:Mannitol-1-phosphate 5-dehydrogenase n=1 Tax=Tessaracoccus rhinocerotis TaxID=1689449 RepID=A0A553K5Z2_9ACTN|nr:tagaturonate reductase [Tessaracoccus rhinocerotis]TRY20129.1 tagaturonate reductase [Tessaracoccus rhinocerotis]
MRVVQFGEGVFLRGFADWMFQRLNAEAGADIRVTLVQPRNSDGVARLMAQGGRWTVVQQGLHDGAEQSRRTVIECVDSGLNTHTNPHGFAALARDPQVRVVVSNTTEAGIAWSEEDAGLGDRRAEVRSFPGKLTWFLAERFATIPAAGTLFVLPVELIADNGSTLAALVRRMADAWGLGPEFQAWLADQVIFLDTLVDRIVPGRPSRPVELAPGVPDAFPVQVEWFHSWYLRGPRELLDVLPLDALDLNVRFVSDLRPYRDLKVRVLNALHSAMAAAGTAIGVESVAEAVDHDVLGPWLRRLLDEEIAPTLDLPADEVADFTAATWDRYRNPFIHHRLESILLNSSAKIPARLGDIALDRGEEGSPLLAFGVAAWLHLTRGAGLSDSPEVLAAVAGLWERVASGDLTVEELAARVLAGPMGAVAWPQPFVAEVGSHLARIGTAGPLTALRAVAAVEATAAR